MKTASATGNAGRESARRKSGGIRAIGIAVFLGLFPVPAHAGEQPDRIPLFSTSDGSRGWVEVTHAGNRASAAPIVEISGEIVREAEAVGATESRLLEGPEGDGGKGPKGRKGFEDFLKRGKAMLIQEGPGGVSFGGAFTLIGDIRDGLRESRNSRKMPEAGVGARKGAPARE